MQAEVVMGLSDVVADLFFQRLGRWPLDLRTKTVEKTNANLSLFVQSNRMKVENVTFNGEGFLAKSGTIAHICNSLKVFSVHLEAGYVHAIGWHQLRIWREVNGRDGVARTTSATGSRSG